MGLIGKMLHNSIDFGGKVADAVGDMVKKTGDNLGDSAAKTALEMKIKVVDSEIRDCYEEIGRRIVLHIRQTRSSPTMEIFGEPLRAAITKTVYKEQLEEELRAMDAQDLLPAALNDKKKQLDQALAAQLLTQQEYDAKLLSLVKTGSF